MPKKVAILQSNYIPWKGYFDIIAGVDLFIFHDDLQYTTGDWRNRNKIKSSKGPIWLSVPCGADENRLICEVELSDSSWQRKHWFKIKNWYQKAPYFWKYQEFFEWVYLEKKWTLLSELNQTLIKIISKEFLFIDTEFEDSRKYHLSQKKEGRVLELLCKTEASEYLSGPSGKNYLNEQGFKKSRIKLSWMDYDGYPDYNQLYSPFDHNVSILDMLFNLGSNTRDFMKN